MILINGISLKHYFSDKRVHSVSFILSNRVGQILENEIELSEFGKWNGLTTGITVKTYVLSNLTTRHTRLCTLNVCVYAHACVYVWYICLVYIDTHTYIMRIRICVYLVRKVYEVKVFCTIDKSIYQASRVDIQLVVVPNQCSYSLCMVI